MRLARHAALSAVVCSLALPAIASATTVSVEIDGANGQTIFPRATVTLPSAPVAPIGGPDGETCLGNSVVGAVAAASAGDWDGLWTEASGWSLERIRGLNLAGSGKRWAVFLDRQYLNAPPCTQTLSADDLLVLYPLCVTATSGCYSNGPMELLMADVAVPTAPVPITVYETNLTFDSQGVGTSQRVLARGATVSGPNGSATTDTRYGTGLAQLPISDRGPQIVAGFHTDHVPTRGTICITDGADGYCGSTVPEPTPFDPLAFCKTTGNDGLCGSPDHVPPVGYVTQPVNGHLYPASGRPRFLKGTVDFDPSQVSSVDIRLLRQSTVKAYKLKTRRVTVRKRVRGKLVKTRVRKKRRVAYRKKACFRWNVATSTWKTVKKCSVTAVAPFKADGGDVWSYEFLTALPAGSYTLLAQARDGAGNVDAAPETGRNQAAFTVR